MDPLSISTGILTLLTACHAASRIFVKIRMLNAPDLLQSLNNEITDLRLLLLDISDDLGVLGNQELTLPHLSHALHKLCISTLGHAKTKVLETEAILQYQILKAGRESELKVNKFAFLTNHSRLVQLRSDLKDNRQKIAGISCQLGLRQTSRIEVMMDNICSNDIPRLRQGQALLSQNHAQIQSTLEQIVRQQSPSSNAIQQGFQSNGDGNILSSSAMGITVSRTRCACPWQRSSMQLSSFFGSVFIGYAAAPKTVQCRGRCSQHKEAKYQLQYFFPTWFLGYAFQFEACAGSGTIRCSLSITQVLPFDHEAYDLLEVEDFDSLRDLIVCGKLSVNAQVVSWGVPLLRHSALIGSVASCSFLLEMGASVLPNGPADQSPQKAAWDRILGGHWSSERSEKMKALFSDTDLDDLYDFSPLHKAVLGLQQTHTIQSVMSIDPSQLNKVDSGRRTPVAWAAARGDLEVVRQLLAYRPDCEKADDWKLSPLALAARRSAEVVELLLQAKVDVHCSSRMGDTVLHDAVRFSKQGLDAFRTIELFVRAGVGINAVNHYGETALHLASDSKIAEYLLKSGADPGICEAGGHSPLSKTIQQNNHDLIGLFLGDGQDHIGELKNYGTLVHMVAEFADIGTLRLLTQKGLLQRRPINITNKAGLTPVRLALQRRNVDTDWRIAFFEFLDSIDDNPLLANSVAIPADNGNESEEVDECFEDAVEFQVAAAHS